MNLRTSFVLHFSPCPISSLPRAILDSEQYEKESLGAAWARFSVLIHFSLDLSLPYGVILRHFCVSIDIEADLCLDMTVGGHLHTNL